MKKTKNTKKKSNNYSNSFVFYGAVIFVFVFMIFIVNNGKVTYSNEEAGEISITCPTKISIGKDFSCDVNLNITEFTTLSVNATYSLPDGFTFVSFEPAGTYDNENGYVFDASETKFALGYVDGLENGVVGSLRLKLESNSSNNTSFNIGLQEIEVTHEDENEEIVLVELDDISTIVNISSDVNTLNSLSIADFELQPIFNSSTTEYTATVTSTTDKINVSAVATDENASIAGIGVFDLHYGTQNFSIVVTSESGIDKEYTLSVYRPYVFETDYYIYNKNANYIYTRDDYTEQQIVSNLTTDENDGVSFSVDNNKLIIKYVDEELLRINIINFKTSVYSVSDNKLYIGKNVTYDDFIENIELNGVTMKVLDNNNSEVTSGDIVDGYALAIYYNDALIEKYDILSQYLNFDIGLTVNDDSKVISRLQKEMTFEALTNKISTSGQFSFKKSDDSNATENDIIGTGSKITIDFGSSSVTYTLSVLGDITGDGYVKINDVSRLYRGYKELLTLTEAQRLAGDVVIDGNIKINDVSRLYRYQKEVISFLEVE